MTDHKGTVTHGTLRYVDLIPEFWEYLTMYHPETTITLSDVDLYSTIIDANSDSDLDDDDIEACGFLLETLDRAMNDIAPEHYYFGAHPGDGSDFGFWLADDLRECDECGLITDAGEWPDWINGKCQTCDPDILDHPDNYERVSEHQMSDERVANFIARADNLTPVPNARPRYDDDGNEIVDIATCGTCGRSWNDAAISTVTPVPAGRCPFEYDHDEADDA